MMNRLKRIFFFDLLLAGVLSAAPSVVITEIMYHPGSDDPRDEYIELVNAGDTAADLTGWAFTKGVDFVFPEGVVLGPGAFIVIAADPERIAASFNLPEGSVAGPWVGSLANEGERIELVDGAGDTVDSVKYDDERPWPLAADGEGPSLECIDPARDNSSARNWEASQTAWTEVSYVGEATSNKLMLYLKGAGTCLIDDLTLTPEAGGETLIANGDFNSSIDPWTANGNHSGSGFSPTGGRTTPGCLKVTATGAGTGSDNGLVTYPSPSLKRGERYRLSFWVSYIEGSTGLVTRLSGGGLERESQISGGYGTAGRTNSVAADELPPLVASVSTDPVLPTPEEAPTVTAEVEADGPAKVTLRYYRYGWSEIELRDDGKGPDETAGDGRYSGTLPSFPAGSLVKLSATAESGDLVSRTYQTALGVVEERVTSNLPVLWIFVSDDDWKWLNQNMWTETYVPALLVSDDEVYSDAGLRFRGGRPRLFRKKSLKLRFNHGRYRDRKRLNLNAAAMDDDYMTEPLAYWFYDRCGVPASEARFVRVQLNGEFWGLFIDVEQVDELYLEKRDLDPEGVLYKAVGVSSNLSDLSGTQYDYETQYEKKTREDEPYDDLVEFIEGLYTARDMEKYLEENFDVENFARYLAATNLMCVWDAIQHNYYIYRPPGGRWRIIPWDLDHAWGEWEWRYYYDNTYHLLMGHEEHHFGGVWYTWNKLWTEFLDVPRFREMYYDFIREFLNTEFAEWRIFPKVEEFRGEIEETVLLDEAKWPDSEEPQHTGPKRTMARELPLLMQTVSRRRAFVANLLGVTLIDEPPEPSFVRGEANGDGKVDVADAVAILGHLFGGKNLECRSAADANDDGRLDIADAVSLLGYLFAAGEPPSEPFPSCGTDPTTDDLDCSEYAPCR